MILLALASLVWISTHWLGPWYLRPALVPRLGENGYLAVFSVLSLTSMTCLVLAYRAAPQVSLWPLQPWMPPLAAGLIAFAFLLIVFGATADNPTAGATGRQPEDGRLPVRGITHVTRHPVMVGIGLWACAHLLANGYLAALLFFGTLLATAVRGIISLDHKTRLKVGPTAWAAFAARTSRLPFAAMVSRRTRLIPAELSWRRAVTALALFGVMLTLHQTVIGLPPL